MTYSAPRVTDDRTFVYFAQAKNGGLIKIGSTLSLALRNIQLKNLSPVEINIVAAVRGTRRHEVRLHDHFSSQRAHGEWFRPCAELTEFLRSLPAWHPEIDESTLPCFAYDQRDLFNNLYRAGFTQTDIAKHFGFSRQRADQQITCERRRREETQPLPDIPIADFIARLLDGAASPLAVEYPQ